MFVFEDKPFSKLEVAEQKEFAAVFRDEICTQPSGLQFCVSTLTAIIEIEINRLKIVIERLETVVLEKKSIILSLE